MLVGQNNGQSKLYKNIRAKKGLIVRLKGQKKNPKSIGAKIQLLSLTGQGAVREIKAGGGYRSQNSATQVLTLNQDVASKLKVIWPNGNITEKSISRDSATIEIEEPLK